MGFSHRYRQRTILQSNSCCCRFFGKCLCCRLLHHYRIQKFDSNGKYLTQWGSYGTGDGQSEYPECVAVDSSGNVYVFDTGNNRIQKFALNLILPVASFSTNTTSGYAPLTVQFTDLSINTTVWNWNFGDGTNSTLQNPMHTYGAGNYTVNLTVSNTNGTDSKLATINDSKSTPIITWSNPANITYGTALSSTQLDATASVPGNFVYTPPSGTVLGAGQQTLNTIFTPTDIANYTIASASV